MSDFRCYLCKCGAQIIVYSREANPICPECKNSNLIKDDETLKLIKRACKDMEFKTFFEKNATISLRNNTINVYSDSIDQIKVSLPNYINMN